MKRFSKFQEATRLALWDFGVQPLITAHERKRYDANQLREVATHNKGSGLPSHAKSSR